MKASQLSWVVITFAILFIAGCTSETAVDNATNSAVPVPGQVSAAGRISPGVTGGGTFECFDHVTQTEVVVTHGFDLRCDGRPNRTELNWNGNQFYLTSVLDAACEDEDPEDPAPVSGIDIHGQGRFNRQIGYQICANFEDNGEPGAGEDEVEVAIVQGTITDCDSGDFTGDLILSCSDDFGTTETVLISGNHDAH